MALSSDFTPPDRPSPLYPTLSRFDALMKLADSQIRGAGLGEELSSSFRSSMGNASRIIRQIREDVISYNHGRGEAREMMEQLRADDAVMDLVNRSASRMRQRTRHEPWLTASRFKNELERLISWTTYNVFESVVAIPDPPPRLGDMVPAQKPAPFEFGYEGEILKTLSREAKPGDDVSSSSSDAREQLIRTASGLLASLTQSNNFDNRLRETVEELQLLLTSRRDIIQLAIANIGAAATFEAAADELPDVLAAQMRAFSSTIGMYVAQFPDWRAFADNAAEVEISDNDLRKIITAAKDAVAALDAKPETVDPAVPASIRFLLEVIGDPKMAGKRTVFALARTMENLVSAVFTRSGALIDAAFSGANKGTEGATKNVMQGALLGLALAAAASGFAPIAYKFGADWMKTAVELVQKQAAAGGGG